jgi:putative phage-type endonuclease
MDDRTKFLGGSDIAAAMGLSRYKTPLQLWAEKTGQIPEEDLSDIEYVQLGSELEDFIAKKFEQKTGLKVRRAPQRYIHKKHPFMACQVDRLVTGTDELVECKNVNAWKAKEWDKEEIPIEYILQVSWQLMITGRSVGYIACLIGGNRFIYKMIQADQELFDKMTQAALKFWELVEKKIMPMACGDDNDTLLAIYPKSNEQLQAIEEMNDMIAALQKIKLDIKEMETHKEEFEARLKEVIGENLGIKTKEYIVKWLSQETAHLNYEALKADGLYEKYLTKTPTRVLRVYKNKEGSNDTGR